MTAAAAGEPKVVTPPPPAPPLPHLLRWTAPPLAALFALGIALRRTAYDLGLKAVRRAPLPVLSVGNLTVGGTGKSPMAAYLAKGLLARKRKPAILMRGYGAARSEDLNDEAREMLRRVPDANLIVNPNRYEGACEARDNGLDVALLDDGFQHWQLARDLDLVLLDATDPFGGEHLLPWGRLREPPEALARAGVVILTRCDQVPPGRLEELEARAQRLAPRALICAARHRPVGLRKVYEKVEPVPPETLAGRRVLAVCGLGHPGAFYATLAALGARIIGSVTYPDHFDYERVGIAGLEEAAAKFDPEWIVVSAKDAVKLEGLHGAKLSRPLWALEIRTQIVSREEELWNRIEHILARTAAP
ncbi:MAG: tetraacyldisaccharide 4'-kinase [Planctomycetota bacterium]|nr:tetraacyldisaccharide 4'-kinase [Planctomycetota bacterium]